LCETGFGRIFEAAAPNLSGYQGSSLSGFITMIVVKTQKKWFRYVTMVLQSFGTDHKIKYPVGLLRSQ
jgi:hypothetical protein